MAHNKKDIPDSDLNTIIKVVRNEDLYQQIGRDVYFDLVDHAKVRSFGILNSTPFNHFKEVVAKQFGVPLQVQRFWMWANRANQTYRPYRHLTPAEEKQRVGQLKRRNTQTGNWELVLLLEGFELGPDLYSFCLPHKTKDDILLFFKLYDPEKEEIRYVGKLFVKGSAMPGDILEKLNDMANFAPYEEIKLYLDCHYSVCGGSTPHLPIFIKTNDVYCARRREINFVPTVKYELIDKERTFRANQLKTGDIICFQKAYDPVQMKCRYPGVSSFLNNILRRQALQVAKSKVIATMDELKKVEENVAPSQLKVIAIKGKLKEVEENMAALQLKAIVIRNEQKEAERNMARLKSKAIVKENELKEAQENVAALEALINP